MGKYLAILDALGDKSSSDQSAKSDKSLPFGRLSRFGRTFSALESRCPDHVPVDRWQQCVEDGRAFLAKWGSQAEALGWDSRDLFGLHIPDKPHPSYSRLSSLNEGQQIEYEIEENRGKTSAVNLKVK